MNPGTGVDLIGKWMKCSPSGGPIYMMKLLLIRITIHMLGLRLVCLQFRSNVNSDGSYPEICWARACRICQSNRVSLAALNREWYLRALLLPKPNAIDASLIDLLI